MTKDLKYRRIFGDALDAGMKAGAAAVPPEMVVYEANPITGERIPGRPTYRVPEGPCGFAWINVRPATTGFARWLKKNGLARKAYHGGIDINVREYGQSLVRKEAYAKAFAKVLRDYGIKAYEGSRMD